MTRSMDVQDLEEEQSEKPALLFEKRRLGRDSSAGKIFFRNFRSESRDPLAGHADTWSKPCLAYLVEDVVTQLPTLVVIGFLRESVE